MPDNSNGRRSAVEKFILGIASVWIVAITGAQLNLNLRLSALERTAVSHEQLNTNDYVKRPDLNARLQDIYEKQTSAQQWRLEHTKGHP